jgi:hypothetical protein
VRFSTKASGHPAQKQNENQSEGEQHPPIL